MPRKTAAVSAHVLCAPYNHTRLVPRKTAAVSAHVLCAPYSHTRLVPRKTAAVSAHVLCAPYNHAPAYTVTSFVATCVGCTRMYLAVTCHLHSWQNDQDRLPATAVTRGWNGYRNNSQHRKLTKILSPFLPGLEPSTFRSLVRRSIPLSYPRSLLYVCSACMVPTLAIMSRVTYFIPRASK